MNRVFDSLVIGGGFYGCSLALFLARRGDRVVVLEQESELLRRASYANQARIHNGYHYPRSFITAMRSVVNFPRFLEDFRECVYMSFEKVYAISLIGSKVNAYQFEKFCRNIGSPIRPASASVSRYFSTDFIEKAFAVKEYAFDAGRLRTILATRLARANVDIVLKSRVNRVIGARGDKLTVELEDGLALETSSAFNCTYSGLNALLSRSGVAMLPLKHEMTELAIVEPPDEMREIGVTVMDGSFFSCMPFPALGLHSLSHVRYTPHYSWTDDSDSRIAPLTSSHFPETHYPYMIKDAQRFMPILSQCRYIRSLFEVKTVLVHNEVDDGRPILLRQHSDIGRFYSVLGGKIDNVYDVLAALSEIQTVAAAAI